MFRSNRGDFPIWRRYDWALGFDRDQSLIILSGRMVIMATSGAETTEKVKINDIFNCYPVAILSSC